MKRVLLLLVLLTSLALVSVASADSGVRGVRSWTADLQPLNNSGVSGWANLTLDGDALTVTIHATGLEPDKTHAQHIHGLAENPSNRTCPTPDADANGDGIVDVGEGVPFYGPVRLGLTPFTTAPGGIIDYTQTFTDLSGLEPVNTLQNRAIVLHGLTIDGGYVGSTPVACGQIAPAPNGP
jgi:Cu/Zn superoxide dismutase